MKYEPLHEYRVPADSGQSTTSSQAASSIIVGQCSPFNHGPFVRGMAQVTLFTFGLACAAPYAHDKGALLPHDPEHIEIEASSTALPTVAPGRYAEVYVSSSAAFAPDFPVTFWPPKA